MYLFSACTSLPLYTNSTQFVTVVQEKAAQEQTADRVEQRMSMPHPVLCHFKPSKDAHMQAYRPKPGYDASSR